MKEAVFPLAGALFVLVLVLPAAALVAKGALSIVERRGLAGPELRYWILTGSAALPIVWFVAAGVGQSASERSALACRFDHAVPTCSEPAFFALLLAGAFAVCVARAVLATPGLRPPAPIQVSPLADRLARLVATEPSLSGLHGRAFVTSELGYAIGTHGLLRPYVLVGADYLSSLGDDALSAALAHEAEHVRRRDPLRFLMLRVVLAVNPFGGWLLAPHAQRWRSGREVDCDREAVLEGAHPLALAHAIVRAARPARPALAALGGNDTVLVKFRVDLLLAFSERAPRRTARRTSSLRRLAALAVLAMAVTSCRTGTSALDAVHRGSERLASHML